jgi:hypothetical protein
VRIVHVHICDWFKYNAVRIVGVCLGLYLEREDGRHWGVVRFGLF